jgi:signal transduction histidine kinase
MKLYHKILIFFLFGTIAPFLLSNLFLLSELNRHSKDLRDSFLNSSKLLIDYSLQNDLNNLTKLNEQAGMLSISDKLKKLNVANKSANDLEVALNSLQKSNKLTFTALIGPKQEIIASSQTFEELDNHTSMMDIVEKSLKGESVKSIEKIKLPDFKDELLVYVSSVPLWDNSNSNNINGVLLIGKSLGSQDSSLKEALQNSPGVKLDITENKKNKNFLEIHNSKDELIGSLALTIQDIRQKEIENTQILFFAIHFFLMLTALAALSYFFQVRIVRPLNEVEERCHDVADFKPTSLISLKGLKGEIKDFIQSFNSMLSSLDKAKKERDSFIATLSHDLKTPLIAQVRALELIEQSVSSSDPEIRKILRGLKLNNETLLQFVKLLLDSYKFESKGLQLKIEEVDLVKLVIKTVNELEPLIQNKDIKFKQEYLIESLILRADTVQLQRVFFNIISNSIENIPNQSMLRIKVFNNKSKAFIVIHDNGPGIPEEEHERIFDKYHSVASKTKKIGTGLGLYISKLITNAHEGNIILESQPGKGTSFIIELPLDNNLK